MQEESSWIGPLAVQMEIAYRVGTARAERSQLSSMGITREEFFAAFGEAINSLILSHRENLEKRSRGENSATEQRPPIEEPPSIAGAFQVSRHKCDPKARWVDGTPEYSFYIHPLHTLFPNARFIHIVRDVTAIVRSLIAFERTGGPPAVQNEQAAFEYWLRAVQACLAAERAYGSEIVYRVRHADLTAHPEDFFRRLLDFLDEPFEAACLQPLGERINSSAVPSDFDSSDTKTDPAVVEAARRLNDAIMQMPAHLDPDPQLVKQLERDFAQLADELANRLAPRSVKENS